MGNSPEPDTKHSLTSDLYTHIKWARITPPETDEEGFVGGQQATFSVGDSMYVSSTVLKLDSLSLVRDEDRPMLGLLEKDLALMACFSIGGKDTRGIATPLYIVRDDFVVPDLLAQEEFGMKMRIDSFDPATEKVTLTIWEHESVRSDFIVMQAIVFPLINVLWLGCILMALGCFMAVRQRIK